MTSRSWIPYAALLVVFWGVWGAFSSLPTDEYGYPDEMIYILWSVTMLIPAYFILRSERTFDQRPSAAIYGLLIGLTGAGGQLVLFKALTIGPAYLIFPIIALSPGITVLMATFLLREQLLGLTKIGIVLALIALGPLFRSIDTRTVGWGILRGSAYDLLVSNDDPIYAPCDWT